MTPMERIEGELSDAQKRIAELEYLLARQAKAAQQGMGAAKSVASSNMEHAKRLHAECSPEALESERAANALLTERIAQLEADCAAHKAAGEVQIALRHKADEREAARTDERDTAAMRLASTRGRLEGALAHIDRIIEARNSRRGDTLANICAVIDETTHQTSLARRDAMMRAQGITDAASRWPPDSATRSRLLELAEDARLKCEQC